MDKVTEHHELSPSAVKRDHTAVDKIKSAILSHGNPFAVEGNTIHNLITHAYVPEEYVSQILDIDNTGQHLYEEYVDKKINGTVSLFAPVKKENNKMYLSGVKKTKVMLRDKAVDLKETKDVYGRLMILTKSSREIDQQHAIGNFEFTLTPRSLFAPNGELLPCNDKSKLIHLLVKLGEDDRLSEENQQNLSTTDVVAPTAPQDLHGADRKIAVVDGMVLVQKHSAKAATIATVKDLSLNFNATLMLLTRNFDEIILVFDTYKPDSLKRSTREKGQGGHGPVQYQVKDNTKIQHITMKRFLSHDQTKADLAEYLADKTLEYNKDASKLVIVCAAGKARSNSDLKFQDNNHEEADTLMIHQAVLATGRNPNAALLTVFFPDTDVFVLVIANYDLLIKNTCVSLASCSVLIEPIWNNLGAEKARALPALHAVSGADNIGRFSRIGKATWVQAYLKADRDVIEAIALLNEAADVTADQMSKLAKFVCTLYSPKGLQIDNIPELRWYLFCKHMAESHKLPLTLGALNQHVDRVHLQARVWAQASVAHQVCLDPEKHGYYKDTNDQLKPVMTDVHPAPKAIIEMVRCQCKGDCSSQRCSCRSNNLTCTDLCLCSSQCYNDEDCQPGGCSDDSDNDI